MLDKDFGNSGGVPGVLGRSLQRPRRGAPLTVVGHSSWGANLASGEGIGRGKTWPLSRRSDPAPPGWEGRPKVSVATDADAPAVADIIARLIAGSRFDPQP